ncbi:hypothetical protein FORC087_352 (plasmid) [Bacillus cereus]|nr:hypothetical protein FORC087_352 [Bacillus cereus]
MIDDIDPIFIKKYVFPEVGNDNKYHYP